MFVSHLPNEAEARTVALTTLVIAELFIALSSRSYKPIYRIGFFSNKKLIIAVLSSFVLQLALLFIGPLSSLFDVVPLTAGTWLSIAEVTIGLFIAIEAGKFVIGYFQKHRGLFTGTAFSERTSTPL